MAQRCVFMDKSEIVLNLVVNHAAVRYMLTNNKIQKFVIEKYKRPLLKVIPREDECIKIITECYPPILVKKAEHGKYYAEYMADFMEYAEKYKIKVENALDNN